MCQSNEKGNITVVEKRRPVYMEMKDLNSNVMDAGKAYSGKYKELTTIGDAQTCASIVRSVAIATVTITLMYLRLSDHRNVTENQTNVNFLHLMSFAAHFGSQFWVTFVAGFAMFFNLPRIMFGRLQCRLFPIYFCTTLILSCVTLVTYTARHPYHTMTWEQTKQLTVLSLCVLSTFINSFLIAPQIVSSIINVFEREKDSGVAYVVGYCDRTQLKKDPQYSQYYKQFRRVHGLSGAANMFTLVCNVVYLYHLASV